MSRYGRAAVLNSARRLIRDLAKIYPAVKPAARCTPSGGRGLIVNAHSHELLPLVAVSFRRDLKGKSRDRLHFPFTSEVVCAARPIVEYKFGSLSANAFNSRTTPVGSSIGRRTLLVEAIDQNLTLLFLSPSTSE